MSVYPRLVAGVVLAVAVGCSARANTAGTPTSQAVPEGPAPSVGRAVHADDVAGTGVFPLRKGFVVAIPEEAAPRLRLLTGLNVADEGGLRHASFTLIETDLIALGGTAATIGEVGGFSLDVATGRYLLCLSNSFPDHEASAPYRIVGCAFGRITPGCAPVVTFGEGGVQVTGL